MAIKSGSSLFDQSQLFQGGLCQKGSFPQGDALLQPCLFMFLCFFMSNLLKQKYFSDPNITTVWLLM